METCNIFLCIVSLVVSSVMSQNIPEARNAYFKKINVYNNVMTIEGMVLSVNVSSTKRCGEKCLLEDSCKSFFHNKLTSLCQTHNISQFSDTLLNSTGTIYFERIIETGNCPVESGFQMIQSYCIQFVFDVVQAATATPKCQSLAGSSLVKITSAEKQTLIENYLNSLNTQSFEIIFIQGNRNYLNGTILQWLYDDGQEFIYDNWNTGQPNNDVLQLFVGMRKGQGFRWHDFRDASYDVGSYICEIDIV